jgi:hypothetical protein
MRRDLLLETFISISFLAEKKSVIRGGITRSPTDAIPLWSIRDKVLQEETKSKENECH